MTSPIEHWHALLRDERGGELCSQLTSEQRARRLRFGDRVLHGQPQQSWPQWTEMVGLGKVSPI